MTAKIYRNLREIAPHLVDEWDVKANGANTLENFWNPRSDPIHWICSKGHRWTMRWDARIDQGQNCPYCSGRRVAPGENDLATCFPEIAKEWSLTLNDDLNPNEIAPFSHKFVWWDCPEDHDPYMQQISKRAGRGTSCPECSKGRGNSKGEFQLGEFLQSLGIEYTQGSRKFLKGMELDFHIAPSVCDSITETLKNSKSASKSLKIANNSSKESVKSTFAKALEYNGEWTHSDAALKPDSKDATFRDYHLRKIDQASESLVDVVFVWEHDWEEHRLEIEKAITLWFATDEKHSILNRLVSYKDFEKDCCDVRV